MAVNTLVWLGSCTELLCADSSNLSGLKIRYTFYVLCCNEDKDTMQPGSDNQKNRVFLLEE